LWPAKLAVFYPYPETLPVWQVAGATLALVAISLAAWRFRERTPYFAIGWAWYLITLLPVLGIIQVGQQSHADRYTYVPLIGISIAIVWGVSEALGKFPRIKSIVIGLGSMAAVACVMATAAQLDHWKNSEALFRHALEVTQRNHVAHLNLGSALWRSGRPAEAADQYRAGLALRPNDAGGHGGLGQSLVQLGDLQAGVAELTEAVRLAPNFGDARFLLGSVLGRLGRTPKAIEHLSEAVRLRPQDPDFHYNLANALATAGRMDEAVVAFRAALERNPSDAMTYYSLGNALASQGRLDDAIANFEQALRLRPSMQEARQRLEYARALRTQQTPQR
jgi:tetratricopeptide (TPR) repeat protein